MTGDEIISLARSHFGESTALTISASEALAFLNAALQELFNDLPADRMRGRVTTTAVSLTAGKGSLTNTWDRVLEVYVDDKPAVKVPKESIDISDYGTSDYFAPIVPIYHIDEATLWVRPTTSTAKVVHLTAPSEITNSASEVSTFSEVWHPALALLVASYMYAQEEDKVQADHYKAEYQQFVSNLTAMTEAKAE